MSSSQSRLREFAAIIGALGWLVWWFVFAPRPPSKSLCNPPDACDTHGRCWAHSDWDPTSRAITLNESMRHELMLRKVRGESLGPTEDLSLRLLNAQFEARLPKPEGRPADVTTAVDEAKLILAQLEDADTNYATPADTAKH